MTLPRAQIFLAIKRNAQLKILTETQSKIHALVTGSNLFTKLQYQDRILKIFLVKENGVSWILFLMVNKEHLKLQSEGRIILTSGKISCFHNPLISGLIQKPHQTIKPREIIFWVVQQKFSSESHFSIEIQINTSHIA